jgi:hypothetical protein
MIKFRIEKILPNGAVVVRPGWVWGGCKGERVRPMTSAPAHLKRGTLIELRDGVSAEDGCLICEVVPYQGGQTDIFPISRGPFSTNLTLQPTS